MKKQIVVIHGGTTFGTREEYLAYLKNREVTMENFKPREDWKRALERELGQGFDVLSPSMPNKTNARYEEWSIWFERAIPFIADDAIFVGHSLGGTFLAKYLSEHALPKTIRAVILVAAPFDGAKGETLTDFSLPSSLSKLSAQAGEIVLLHSTDDPVVPFEELGKYQKALPGAATHVFNDKGHFNRESFPEIITLIKNAG